MDDDEPTRPPDSSAALPARTLEGRGPSRTGRAVQRHAAAAAELQMSCCCCLLLLRLLLLPPPPLPLLSLLPSLLLSLLLHCSA